MLPVKDGDKGRTHKNGCDGRENVVLPQVAQVPVCAWIPGKPGYLGKPPHAGRSTSNSTKAQGDHFEQVRLRILPQWQRSRHDGQAHSIYLGIDDLQWR